MQATSPDGPRETPRRARLTEGPVARSMFWLSLPMMVGIFAAIGFNLADTYFVAELGVDELAAMTFTFPIVLVMMGVSWGLGTGAMSSVSRAIGGGDEEGVVRLATDSLVFSFLAVLVLAAVGVATIDPLFQALGAEPHLLPLIGQYMTIWYGGMVFLVVPMVANAIIRATGDTKLPALVIVGAMLVNVILDPILIFGWGPVPPMGLRGAALATVITRGAVMVASVCILHFRERLLDWHPAPLRQVMASWREVLRIGIPATVTNLFTPIASAVLTRMIAAYGAGAVAAFGAGTRVSAFVMIPILGYCSALAPFVGQNWGAGRRDRVRRARNLGILSSVAWGGLAVLGMSVFGERVGRLFSDDAGVVVTIALFLKIVPFGYAMVGVLSVAEEALNAIGRPFQAAFQTFVHDFVFWIPFAYLGSRAGGLSGLFQGLAAADWAGGVFALVLVVAACRDKRAPAPAQA